MASGGRRNLRLEESHAIKEAKSLGVDEEHSRRLIRQASFRLEYENADSLSSYVRFYSPKVAFGVALFGLKYTCLHLEFHLAPPFEAMTAWTPEHLQLFLAASAAFLIILCVWTLWWLRSLFKTWGFLKKMNYARTRPSQLAFGFFWSQAILGDRVYTLYTLYIRFTYDI